MSRTFFGFYELDAAPQHGLPADFATRLGVASETDGFEDGTVYVRSDNGAVAIQMNYGDEDGWETRGGPGVLIQAADWRSRSSDARTYRRTARIVGDGALGDSTFFIVQRFVVARGSHDALVGAIVDYTETYARPIVGFLAADAYVSLDETRVVFVMPWAHESALSALENRDGSLAAMQKHLRLSESHSYGSYARVSYLRGMHAESNRGAAPRAHAP